MRIDLERLLGGGLVEKWRREAKEIDSASYKNERSEALASISASVRIDCAGGLNVHLTKLLPVLKGLVEALTYFIPKRGFCPKCGVSMEFKPRPEHGEYCEVGRAIAAFAELERLAGK
jgi:hypothetical protein